MFVKKTLTKLEWTHYIRTHNIIFAKFKIIECFILLDHYGLCRIACSTKQCSSENNPDFGCDEKFTCINACKMRHLGVDVETCKSHCRQPEHCKPAIQGFVFQLCAIPCTRHSCQTSSPTEEECIFGCDSYWNHSLTHGVLRNIIWWLLLYPI